MSLIFTDASPLQLQLPNEGLVHKSLFNVDYIHCYTTDEWIRMEWNHLADDWHKIYILIKRTEERMIFQKTYIEPRRTGKFSKLKSDLFYNSVIYLFNSIFYNSLVVI